MPTIPKDAFVIIIGAMKAGTTTLYRLLSEHPAICPARIKEPDFFLNPEAGVAVPGSYEALWRFDPIQHRFVVEASTSYTKHISKGVPDRMCAYGLVPRLIYVLRDPFKRIESEHNFMIRHTPGWPWAIDCEGAIATSDYMSFIDKYEAVFGSKSIFLIDFDDLTQDPLRTRNEVLDWLELERLGKFRETKAFNVTRDRTKLESKIIGPFRPLIRLMPEQTKDIGKKIFRPALSAFASDGEMVVLTEGQRDRIWKKLYENMQRLERTRGFNVKKWGF